MIIVVTLDTIRIRHISTEFIHAYDVNSPSPTTNTSMTWLRFQSQVHACT